MRINGVGTPWFRRDLEELVSRAGERIDSIVVPKVEDAEQLRLIDAGLDELERQARPDRPIALEALIETAVGLRAIDADRGGQRRGSRR